MALRLRRGTNAERLVIIPLEGEIIYTTDTKALYAGDGVTVGGNLITGAIAAIGGSLEANIDLNSYNIIGTGNINIDGTIVAPSFVGDGSQLTGVTVEGIAGPFIGDLTGSVFADDSALLVDAQNNKFFGNLTGDVTGNVIGNTTGIHTGDVNGSIFADDSTLIIDGTTAQVVGTVNNQSVTTNFLRNSNSGIVASNYMREESSWAGGQIEFTKHNHGVSINNIDTVYWTNSYSTDQMIFFPNPAGGNYSQFFKIWANGKVMINGDTGISGFDDLAKEPDSQLDIYGVMKLAPQTAEPASPVEGMIAVADRVTWDPATVGSGPSYPVYYDGIAWNKMT
tara:strand:+ start:774 stop:1787 length:1014 start_codon:yes stop_codon:yes gene_type:complete